MLVLGSNDKDIEALSSLLTDEALSSLMQDRPSLLSYNKENSGLVFEDDSQTQIAKNEKRASLEFKGKDLVSSEINQNDIERVEQFLAKDPVDISNDSTTKEKAKEVYKNIGTVTNSQTGDKVQFVNSVFGKISRHKDYDPRLIGQLGSLFRNATFLFDEKADFDTPKADGTMHKKKNNIVSFSNYGARISIDGKDYIVRYSVQNTKNKKGTIGERQFHSQQLSSIKIISDPTNLTTSLMWGEEGVASDYKLASFFTAVKQSQQQLQQQDNIYNKNIDFIKRSEVSVLVPYTTEQMVGRIRVGKPVDTADIQTLLETDTSMTEYQRSVLTKELEAIRTLTANPILYNTILDKYSQTQDITKAYEETVKTMRELDKDFKFLHCRS